MTDFPKVLKVYSLPRVRKTYSGPGFYLLGRMVGLALIIGMGLMGVGAIITAVVPSAVEHQSK